MHLLHRSNDTGRVRERTIRRKPSCEIVSGATPQGSLVKGSWHGEAVTEGFYSRHFFKVQTYVKRGRFFSE